ncbi:hypothetical protein [Mariprofundus erugo]|uniref:hypothetical protein n=1 Tax=Mariprofundus erugo TaxID=2528639 RepID=UPI0010FECF07|nr:hypothetical protein [Mariprofundus erugo]
MNSRTFAIDQQGTNKRIHFNGAVAAIGVFAFALYSGFGIMIGLVGAAAGYLLAWGVYGIRQAVGSASALTINDAGMALTVKGKDELYAWDDVALARFDSVNGTPWLIVKNREKKKRMFCLEKFSEQDVHAIMEMVDARISDRLEIRESWAVAHTIPFSIKHKKATVGEKW